MDLSRKSVGFLIDELVTTLIKCWFAQEAVMHEEDEEVVAKAAKKAQKLNARRNQLIRAIDEILGDGDISPTEKTYN